MQKTIFVVEDDSDILEILEYLLTDAGFIVKTSRTAEQIFTKIQEEKPDLILLDIMIFDIDGRDICKQLKANIQTRDIPVIMLSAHPDIALTIEQVCANDYVSKPFDIDYLINKISRYVNAA